MKLKEKQENKKGFLKVLEVCKKRITTNKDFLFRAACSFCPNVSESVRKCPNVSGVMSSRKRQGIKNNIPALSPVYGFFKFSNILVFLLSSFLENSIFRGSSRVLGRVSGIYTKPLYCKNPANFLYCDFSLAYWRSLQHIAGIFALALPYCGKSLAYRPRIFALIGSHSLIFALYCVFFLWCDSLYQRHKK